MLFLATFFIGCSIAPKDKTEYGPWQTDKFRVWAIVGPESKDGPYEAILNTFKNGEIIEVEVPVGDYKEGQEVTLTYRKVTKTICTDQNCRFEESYEVK